MSNIIYDNLIKQYNNLSMEEKRAILIYKSPLNRLMNAISGVPNFVNKDSYYIAKNIDNLSDYIDDINKFRDMLNKDSNRVFILSIFNDIDFDNCYNLIECLKNKYIIMKNASRKIRLSDDLEVYRGVSVNDRVDIEDISHGNIISTSIKRGDSNLFLFKDDINVSYTIKLKKGTNVLVSPMSLVYVYKDIEDDVNVVRPTDIKLINRKDSGKEEIIFFKDDIDIKHISYDDSDFNFIDVLVDTDKVERGKKMDNSYYIKLADKVMNVIVNKNVGENLIYTGYSYVDMLKSDALDDDAKHKVAILAEQFIANTRDIPDISKKR